MEADQNMQPTAPQNPFIPRASFGPEEYDEVVSILRTQGDPVPGFAQMLTGTLALDPRIQDRGPEYLDYNALRTGKAGVLQDLGIPQGRGLSDEQIISLFATDLEGNPIQAGGGFLQGMAREAAPAIAGSAGFFKGVQVGNKLVSGVPPTSPAGAATRIGVPIITGLGFAIGADLATRAGQEAVIGDEPLFVPGTKEAFEAGKTTMGALAFLPMPYMIKPTVNLGAKAILENIGQETAPRSARIVGGIESALERTGQRARGEMGTLPQVGLAASELGAVAGTGAGAYMAEDLKPGDAWTRFGFELTTGLAGGLGSEMLIQRTVETGAQVANAIRNRLSRMADERAANMQNRYTERQLDEAGDYLLRQLELNKENPEEVIRLLESSDFDQFLVDESGNPIKMTAAEMTGSPTLLRMQMERGDTQKDPGQSKAAQAVDGLRRGILGLYANADQEALGALSDIQTNLWDAELSQRVAQATDRVRRNMERVGVDPETFEGIDSREAARKLKEQLEAQKQAMRREESKLWQSSDQDRTSEFRDAEGNVVEKPNFVQMWEREVTDYSEDIPEAKNPIMRIPELRDLDDFVQRKGQELGLSGYQDSATAAVLPEERNLDAAVQKLTGQGRDFDLFQRVLSEAENFETTQQKLDFIKQAAQNLTRTDLKPSELDRTMLELVGTKAGKPGANDIATALNRQADVLEARAKQSVADATPPEPGDLSIQELRVMRQTALNAGRKLSSGTNPDPDKARIAYMFADALLDDMAYSFDPANRMAYDSARAYSKAFNDVWSRAYGGEILGTVNTGANRIPIDILAEKAFSTDAAFMRAQQLDQISQVQVTQSLTNLLDEADRAQGADLLSKATTSKIIDPKTETLDPYRFRSWVDNNKAEIDAIPGLNEKLQQIYLDNLDVRGATEQLIRSARAAALDPDGETLNVNALRRWMRQPANDRLLTMMPALRSDLENVTTARQLLAEETAAAKALNKERRQEELSLYELLPDKTLNPATRVSKAISLTNERPFVELNSLWRYVDSVGEDGFTVMSGPFEGSTFTRDDVVGGLRRAIFDSVFNQGGKDGPIFNVMTAQKMLFEPHPNSPAKLSLADWMKAKDIISEDELKNVQKLISRMAQVQAFSARATPGDLERFAEEMGPVFELALRVTGANLGSKVGQLMGGSSQGLVAPAAGSKFLRGLVQNQLFELPASSRSDIILGIAEDPRMLATVLRRGKQNRQEGMSNAMRFILRGLVDNGILSNIRRTLPAVQNIGAADSEGTPQEEPVYRGPVPVQQAAPQPRPQPAPQQPVPPLRPPQLPTQGAGAATSPGPQASAAPQRPPIQSSGPVDRARFAALFPEDRELMGIASLMGG